MLQTAFQITGPRGNRDLADTFRHGNEAKKKGVLKWLPIKGNRVSIGYEINSSFLQFCLFLDGLSVGNVAFEFIEGPGAPLHNVKLKRLFKANKAVVPHATLAPALRKLGYASFIYTKALKSGFTLITDKHTEEAAELWTRVAKTTGAHLWYIESSGRLLESPTRTAAKIMSLDPTFGLKRP